MFFYPFLLVLLSVALIAGIHSLAMVIGAAVVYGIGSAICMPTLTALLADNSDPHERGRVYSFFFGAFDFGVLSAGVSLGFLADLFGLRVMFLSAAIIGLLAAVFFMLTIQPTYGQSIRWTLVGK